MSDDIVERLRLSASAEAEFDGDPTLWLQAADEIEHSRRLLQWCRMRLKRECYRELLDRYIAAGPQPVDPAKMIHAHGQSSDG